METKPNEPEKPRDDVRAAEARYRDFYELCMARLYGRRLTPEERARYNRHNDV